VGTAEISLILSGAAAASICAVAITYRLGRERFDHERRLSDLDAVRRVLDEATASMQDTHAAMAAVNKHLDAYAYGKRISMELARDDRLALEAAYDLLAALTERLQIRFGSEHELVAIHNGAGSTALAVAYYVDLIEGAANAAAAVDEHRSAVDRAVVEFGLARQSFTLVAYRVVGVRLPALQLSEV
jgi:hypothetical protein